MKKEIPFFMLLLLVVGALPAQVITTTWYLEPGSDNKVVIPTHPGVSYIYDYDVDWDGDGIYDVMGATGNVSHVYSSSGAQTVHIRPNNSSTFPAFFFRGLDHDDRIKLTGVTDWGGTQWQTFGLAFYGCSNLTTLPANAPDLSQVTDISYAFSGATSFDVDISNWDVSNITDMRGTFMNASSFNQNLSNWAVNAVTDMSSLFAGASAFNQPLANWNTGAVTNMSAMFANATSFNYDFQQSSSWTTSSVEDMSHLFEGAVSFDQYIGDWDMSSATDLNNMLSASGLSDCNYQATLNGWESQVGIASNLVLGADGLFYGSSFTSRANLMSNKGWQFDGDHQSKYDVCPDPSWFVTRWSIPAGGTTVVTIPTQASLGNYQYNYDIDWDNDGVFDPVDQGLTGDASHSYVNTGSAPMTVTINIRGTFPAIWFNNGGSKDLITEIVQWGDIQWSSFVDAFYGCTHLTLGAHLPPDMSNVTSAHEMFRECTSFVGPMQDWDMSNVSDLSGMFNGASSLIDGGVGSWENSATGRTTSGFVDLTNLFAGCTQFNANISNWNTSSVTHLTRTFLNAQSFNQPIGSWDVGKVTTMIETFALTKKFDQDISDWNVSKVTRMLGMFNGAEVFNNGGIDKLGNWERTSPDVSTLANVWDMEYFFFKAYKFDQDISNWNTAGATTMKSMFNHSLVFDQDLSAWNVSNVTNMEKMFFQANSFTNGGQPLNGWERTSPTSSSTANVTTMFNMFAFSDFNSGIDNWDVSSVTNMSNMFRASPFNKSVGSWDVSSVQDMSFMFANTPFNQALNNWERSTSGNTSTTQNVKNMSSMFYNANDFNQPIGDWNVTAVENMSYMFASSNAANNYSFNQPLANWQRSTTGNSSTLVNVKNMLRMFWYTDHFDQPIGNWNVSNVENMFSMFDHASAFNQSLGNWKLNSIVNAPQSGLLRMLDDCGMNRANYDLTLHGWNQNGNIVPNVDLGAQNMNFCSELHSGSGATAITNIEHQRGWTITGDGENCNVPKAPGGSLNSGSNSGALNQMSIYQPAQGVLQVDQSNPTKPNTQLTVKVFSASGQLVYQAKQSASNNQFYLPGIATGIYTVTVEADQKVHNQKIQLR
ncbi:BspA family leucine-rich repeat surface protein [bacterium SCSIO 12741]|nr:BspA family leucine-rich repeat surface protein [bacterium SCSIO 12741]